MPKKIYKNNKIRQKRKKQGITLFYISLICGVPVVLEFIFFPKNSFLYFLAILSLIVISFLECFGGFLYGMAKRDEMIEKIFQEEKKTTSVIDHYSKKRGERNGDT